MPKRISSKKAHIPLAKTFPLPKDFLLHLQLSHQQLRQIEKKERSYNRARSWLAALKHSYIPVQLFTL